MSFAEEALAEKCNELTGENRALEAQNERLAHLLADALDILDKFQVNAKDHLRHFGCDRKRSGKFDPKKLESR